MINIIIKSSSEKIDNKWMPAGIVRFPSGPTHTERVERCYDVKFDTEEEANQYFMQVCKKKYRIIK